MKPTAEDWKRVFNDLNIAMGQPTYDGPAVMPTDEYINNWRVCGEETPNILRAWAFQETKHRQRMRDIHNAHTQYMWTMTAFAVALMVATPLVIWVELAVNYYLGK